MKNKKYDSLFRYTIGEDIANAVSHGIAALASFVGLIYLVYVASTKGTVADVFIYSIFGTALVLTFLMSTLYHAIFHSTTRDVFKRLDHSFVFILILGTYTPYTFTALNTTESYIVYGLLSALTLAAVLINSIFVSKSKIFTAVIAVFMGWLSVALVRDLYSALEPEFFVFLLMGGIFYTVGAVIYAVSKFKYHHFIWHIFVILGAVSHFISIAFYIL